MLKSLMALAMTATLLAGFATDGQALSIARPQFPDAASVVTPVRDGCGIYRHFSYKLRRCVPNY